MPLWPHIKHVWMAKRLKKKPGELVQVQNCLLKAGQKNVCMYVCMFVISQYQKEFHCLSIEHHSLHNNKERGKQRKVCGKRPKQCHCLTFADKQSANMDLYQYLHTICDPSCGWI